MAAKKLHEFPPSYDNLAFGNELVAGPSVRTIQHGNLYHGYRDPAVILSVPPFQDEDFQRVPDLNPPSLVFEDIYDACVRYIEDSCCYGYKFINQMEVTNIHNTRALFYALESFGEMRQIESSDKPYSGGPVDGPENGPVPNAWDIRVRTPRELFQDDWTRKEIPHTQRVETCFRCSGSGKEECRKCGGSGNVNCYRCNGSGRDDDGSCLRCSGSGNTRCSSCTRGKVTCRKCDGCKRLLHYYDMKVTWKNHRAEFFTDTDKLPTKLLRKTKRTVLFQEQRRKVQPVITSDRTVNAASVRLLIKHDSAFTDKLIIWQRHAVVGFPFTRIKYTWKDRDGEFYIYGLDREVYFENYPQQCCCCTCC